MAIGRAVFKIFNTVFSIARASFRAYYVREKDSLYSKGKTSVIIVYRTSVRSWILF